MQIISRKDAKQAGLRRYYTGKECLRGHISERYTSSRKCCDCNREYQSALSKKITASPILSAERSARNKKNNNRLSTSTAFLERKRQNTKLWTKNNPEKARDQLKIKRARRRAAGKGISRVQVSQLLALQNSRCASCECAINSKSKNSYHLDHITPIARGGNNDRDNIQILCPKCNLKKGAKDPVSWANENGRLL